MRPELLLAELQWDPAALPIVLPLAVAVLAVSLLGYVRWSRVAARERRRPRGIALMSALRALGLLALVAALLRPAALRPAGPGTTLILLDCSLSMSAIDTARSTGQWVALADALDRLPPHLRTGAQASVNAAVAQTARELDDFDLAQREVEFNRQPGSEQNAAQAHLQRATTALTEAARRLVQLKDTYKLHDVSLATLLTELDHLQAQWPERLHEPRGMDQLAQLLKRIATAAADFQLAEDARLYNTNPAVHKACDALHSLDRLSLAQAALTAPNHGLLAALGGDPIAFFSISDDARPISDPSGLQANGASTDLPAAIHSAMTQVAGHSVRAIVLLSDGRQTGASPVEAAQLAGGEVPLIAIAVAVPNASRDVAIVRVDAPPMLFVGETATVTVQARGHPPEVRLNFGQITLTARTDNEDMATFNVPFQTPGLQTLTAEAPASADDPLPANNRRSAIVKVIPRRIKVALLAPEGDERAGKLRQLLGNLPAVQLSDSTTPEDLAQQDVILLYNLASESLSAAQMAAIRQAQRGGGGVIFIAGEQHPTSDDVLAWADLLPIEPTPHTGALPLPPQWRTWPGDDSPFRFQPASDAVPMQWSGTAAQTRQHWDSLPPPKMYLPAEPLRPDARPLLLEESSGKAVIAQRVSTLLIGLDLDWFSRAVPTDAQEYLWLQWLLAVAGRQYPVGAGALQMDVTPTAPRPGQTLSVDAVIRGIGPGPVLRARVMSQGRVIESPAMSPGPDGSHCQIALAALPAGQYEIAVGPDVRLPGVVPLVYPLTVADDDSAELSDVNGDREYLARLVEHSGGKVLGLEQLAQLPEQIRALRARPSRWVTVNLWDSTYLFGFVAACFTAEWALRKRAGMA